VRCSESYATKILYGRRLDSRKALWVQKIILGGFVMKRRSWVMWAALLVFGFALLSGGCGGGSDGDSSGGGGGSSSYSFNDLEGSWTLVPGTGHGTASGNVSGYPVSGTAECQTLNITIGNIQVNADATLADAVFLMATYWTIAIETPYGSTTTSSWGYEISFGADDVEDPPKLRKTGSNVFVYEYSVNGGDIYNSTITITLISPTTANVRQTFNYTGGELAGTVDNAEVNYSLRKTSSSSNGNNALSEWDGSPSEWAEQ
jgi:hypothetical protein